MSRLLCCLCDMGAALSHAQEGEACDGAGLPVAPPTMADVIRERKKKAGGAGLGTLRRRIAAAARRPRDSRPDRGCEHARFIRSVVSSWRLAEVFLLCEDLEAGAALRDLATQADLAREPAAALHADLAAAYRDRWWFDVELVGAGWSLGAHRAILAARCTYFRDLLQRYPSGSCRVPLTGVAATLSRAELDACLCALYQGSAHSADTLCHKCEVETGPEGELDIINGDNNASWRSGRACVCGAGTLALRRLGARLGFSLSTLCADTKYLLDSGEYSDARLVFRLEAGCGAQYGFRSSLELPCHRLLLAARSRFFRSVMSRRPSGATAAHAQLVCVDEKVLPRRFARALLHAAYTDLVDLSLIGRASSSPSSTNTTSTSTSTTGNSGWTSVSRGASASSTSMLDDAFQLYEIARFLEMPIVVQGCEDAIVEALSPETLPHILRWSTASHASQWVHRQAMRYFRDEFPSIMAHSAAPRLPRAALSETLASPFLQASELQALRALLRWGSGRESVGAVWHTGQSARRRGSAHGSLDALLPLVRLEHLPHDNTLLLQAVRRGILPAQPSQEGTSSADAWLGRGSNRPARCFLPYLDEIKALLEDQVIPETEVARLRRARYLHRIPDTLYMVAAARGGGAGAGSQPHCAAPPPDALCVSPRLLCALRRRLSELTASPPASLRTTHPARRQIALRAVREMSLPDECADLLLNDTEPSCDRDRERDSGEWEESAEQPAWPADLTDDCQSRSMGGAGYLSVSASASSLRDDCTELHKHEGSRTSTCRRELPSRPEHNALRSVGVGAGQGGECSLLRLSAAVPDVAMAPNANTHLLTARDYFRHQSLEYTGGGGGVLQLDLGDGATHTPRPGSRAQRAAQFGERARRDLAPTLALACARARGDDDELRAAIELSVIRAYSSFQPVQPVQSTQSTQSEHAHTHAHAHGSRARTLTHNYRHERNYTATVRGRATPSPSRLSASNSGHLSATQSLSSRHADLLPVSVPVPVPMPAGRLAPESSGAESRADGAGSSPAPRRHLYPAPPAYRPHDYRLEPSYGSSGSGSRGQSPNNYA